MKYESFKIEVSAETLLLFHDILDAALEGKDVKDKPNGELLLIRNEVRSRIQHFPMGLTTEEDWLE